MVQPLLRFGPGDACILLLVHSPLICRIISEDVSLRVCWFNFTIHKAAESTNQIYVVKGPGIYDWLPPGLDIEQEDW